MLKTLTVLLALTISTHANAAENETCIPPTANSYMAMAFDDGYADAMITKDDIPLAVVQANGKVLHGGFASTYLRGWVCALRDKADDKTWWK